MIEDDRGEKFGYYWNSRVHFMQKQGERVRTNNGSLKFDMKNTGEDFHTFLKKYISAYSLLIQEIRKTNDCPIILMEPFIFPWPAIYSSWESDVTAVSLALQELAYNYKITFLPLWEKLSSKAKELGYDAVTLDGVHLTSLGHQIIADSLISVLETL